MGKQELSLKVVPDNATHKGLVVTLADSSLASITPTANGVELDARKGGTTSLKVESHHGEVTKTIPVNVQEATDLLVDGKLNTGARYVKDTTTINNYFVKAQMSKLYFSGVEGLRVVVTNDVALSSIVSVNPGDVLNIKKLQGANRGNRIRVLASQDYPYEGMDENKNQFKVLLQLPSTVAELSEATVTIPEGCNYALIVWSVGSDAKDMSSDIGFYIAKNSAAPDRYYPAPEDYGVVHGQPNLLNGASSTPVSGTFSGWNLPYERYDLASLGLNPGDTISYTAFVDNTETTTGGGRARVVCTFLNSEGKDISVSSTAHADEGTTRRVQISWVIPANTTKIALAKFAKDNATGSATIKISYDKLIKGSLTAMDEWTPSQADSGLTIKNNGMVPFNSTDYANLLAKDQVVRAETKIYGRGASVDLRFDVLKAIDTKYPSLLAEATDTADKLTKLLSLIKKVYFVHASRGGGVSFDTATRGTARNAVQSAMFLRGGHTAWALGQNNKTANFLESGTVLPVSYVTNIETDGSYTFRISTYRNLSDATFDDRALSDGVTPAWVEVKDARLEVSIQPPEDPNAKPITITVTPS